MSRSFIYYGYDKETYHHCRELIQSTNFNHTEILNIWFMLDAVMFIAFSRFNIFGVDQRRTIFYLVYFAIAAVFAFILWIFRKRTHNRSMIFAYLETVLLVSFSVLASDAQTFMAATMFPVILVVIALSFIDSMLRMGVVLILYSVIFVWRSNGSKPYSIASLDTYNTIVFLILALILHYTFQRARMQQFETYQRNVQITRELEVKSSFDALTSLLNRGRFFSMAGEVLRMEHDDYIAVCILDLDSF